ncbi:hypothetical protein D3C87_2166590 [compost metagenome]
MSPNFSSAAACVLRWMVVPSWTRFSNTLPPSACAFAKAPRPASQICWADSRMLLTKSGLGLSVFLTMIAFR